MNRSAPHIDIRVLCNDDYDAVIRLVSELDADERYRRFLTRYPTYIGEWALSLTTPSDHGCALGAFESGDLQGVANYVDTSEDGCAEVAIVVAHEQHHRGIGTALLHELGRQARSNGMRCFVADVLAANHAVHEVIREAGWPVTVRRDGEMLKLRINIDAAGGPIQD